MTTFGSSNISLRDVSLLNDAYATSPFAASQLINSSGWSNLHGGITSIPSSLLGLGIFRGSTKNSPRIIRILFNTASLPTTDISNTYTLTYTGTPSISNNNIRNNVLSWSYGLQHQQSCQIHYLK